MVIAFCDMSWRMRYQRAVISSCPECSASIEADVNDGPALHFVSNLGK